MNMKNYVMNLETGVLDLLTDKKIQIVLCPNFKFKVVENDDCG